MEDVQGGVLRLSDAEPKMYGSCSRVDASRKPWKERSLPRRGDDEPTKPRRRDEGPRTSGKVDWIERRSESEERARQSVGWLSRPTHRHTDTHKGKEQGSQPASQPPSFRSRRVRACVAHGNTNCKMAHTQMCDTRARHTLRSLCVRGCCESTKSQKRVGRIRLSQHGPLCPKRTIF